MDPERRKRLLIIVTAICVGAWAADRLILTPSIDAWIQRADRIKVLDKDIAESADLLSREGELKERWQTMKKESLPKRISDAESMVFQAVSRWAGDSSLSVTSLKPRWTRVAPIAQTLEIQLEAVGSMEALAKFLYDLETDPIPIKVEDIQISARDDKGSALALSVRFSGLVVEETSS